ncbi:MAG: hypothetical protein IJE61_06300 [Bacteroidales bacterium]|nr:hypothetical protein [Bacteroidales bacterium]
MVKANEVSAAFMPKDSALADRKLFVQNLGELLSQTREGILAARLDNDEFVTVIFKRGDPIRVNVNMDSYFAIIKDVVKAIDS